MKVNKQLRISFANAYLCKKYITIIYKNYFYIVNKFHCLYSPQPLPSATSTLRPFFTSVFTANLNKSH